jgi:hypothetical protein
MKLPHASDVHSGMLSNPGDHCPVWQGDALVSESNRHHCGGDQGVEVDGGLDQESLKKTGSLDGDHDVVHHRVHSTDQNVLDAPDIVVKVAQLEIALSL